MMLMSLRERFKKFDSVNLRLRIISAAILIPVTLFATWLGGIAFGALVTCIVTVAIFEWLRLVGVTIHTRLVAIACGLMIVMMTAGLLFSVAFGAMLGVIATLALFLLSVRAGDDRAGWIALGIPYIGSAGLALLMLRETPHAGMGLVFYLFLVVWGTDIGAFVAGRMIGGAKLAPAISPGKTWAGLWGGMALAVILGYLIARGMGANYPRVALLLSPVLAVVAQLGDLFESYFKRRAGVKESGDLIPGHGGVLDRIDGLIFAGVFLALFQLAIGQDFGWF